MKVPSPELTPKRQAKADVGHVHAIHHVHLKAIRAALLGGGYLIASGYHISPLMYFKSLPQFMRFQDLIEGVAKPAFFGFLIVMIACHVGLRVSGGAEGVGVAVKRTVVIASVCILVSDFFIAKIFIAFR